MFDKLKFGANKKTTKDCNYKVPVLKCLEVKHELFKIEQNQIVPFWGTCENHQNLT